MFELRGKHSLILKLFFRCVRKLSVCCIQTVHATLLPLQVYWWSWQGCRLVIQTCSNQLIDFIDLKYPSSSLFNLSSVDFLLVCILFIGSDLFDPETCPRVCQKFFSAPYTNRTYWFASPAGTWKVLTRVTFLIFQLSSSIHWLTKSPSSQFPQANCSLC